MEEDTLNQTYSPSVEDRINSFVSSDTEPQDNEFAGTFNLIDIVYGNVKYKKIKTFCYRT